LTDEWPVIVIDFPETRLPDSALEGCLSCIEELLREAKELREKTYTVTDLTRMYEFPPAAQRKYTSEWLARSHPLQKVASLGGATVARSTMLRGIINAVHWVSPPAMPSIFVATRHEAYAEALKAFDNARITVSPELRALLTRQAPVAGSARKTS
jgi:hypothetical protein